MPLYQYRKSHCGDKIVRSSFLHNGISYTGKMTSLYWIRAQVFNTCQRIYATSIVSTYALPPVLYLLFLSVRMRIHCRKVGKFCLCFLLLHLTWRSEREMGNANLRLKKCSHFTPCNLLQFLAFSLRATSLTSCRKLSLWIVLLRFLVCTEIKCVRTMVIIDTWGKHCRFWTINIWLYESVIAQPTTPRYW